MSIRKQLKSIILKYGVLAAVIAGSSISGTASAGGPGHGGNNECPVGLVNGMTLDDEFGTGTSDVTNCLERRHNVKIVMQLNEYCRDDGPWNACTRPYALGNISNMIKDYEITHDMEVGKDYEIAVVVHSGGGRQMINDPVRNVFVPNVTGLLSKGVKFYFCQNTTRKYQTIGLLPADATGDLIPGVQYVTAGVTAIADFQSKGYRYVQP